MAKASDGWRCNGYGSGHGFRAGRLWFVCSKCRWAPNYRDPVPDAAPAKTKPASAGCGRGYSQKSLPI